MAWGALPVIGGFVEFLAARVRALASYVKKVADPRFVIAFTVAYPHVYQYLQHVIDAARSALLDMSGQLWSWAEALFESVREFVDGRISWMPFHEQIAGAVAGLAAAPVVIACVAVRYILVPVAYAALSVALSVLGAVYYIMCRVVIPALRYAFGAYLAYKWLPMFGRGARKAVESFARGSLAGVIAGFLGMAVPGIAFFAGPALVDALIGNACAYAVTVPAVLPPYALPYVPYYPAVTALPAAASSVVPALFVYFNYAPYYVPYIIMAPELLSELRPEAHAAARRPEAAFTLVPHVAAVTTRPLVSGIAPYIAAGRVLPSAFELMPEVYAVYALAYIPTYRYPEVLPAVFELRPEVAVPTGAAVYFSLHPAIYPPAIASIAVTDASAISTAGGIELAVADASYIVYPHVELVIDVMDASYIATYGGYEISVVDASSISTYGGYEIFVIDASSISTAGGIEIIVYDVSEIAYSR
ncbi:MAG: hypothetical protein LM577_07055 [Thermoproteaceae archaeon]|nr:hypothetical protein [Thermoproteaceae archaeon]